MGEIKGVKRREMLKEIECEQQLLQTFPWTACSDETHVGLTATFTKSSGGQRSTMD